MITIFSKNLEGISKIDVSSRIRASQSLALADITFFLCFFCSWIDILVS